MYPQGERVFSKKESGGEKSGKGGNSVGINFPLQKKKNSLNRSDPTSAL